MVSQNHSRAVYRYVRVADAIRSQVVSGHYQPGQQLPPQHELAREHGVAFTTLKKALDVLTEEGYVDRRVGEGTFASLPREARQSALVVDDEQTTRAFMSRAIARHGWRCVVASSGSEALARVAEEQFDLIFLDLSMPGMSGAETFSRIRRIDPGANVVISTAYPDSELMAEALRVGRFSLLPKPFGPDQLGLTLDAAATRPQPAGRER